MNHPLPIELKSIDNDFYLLVLSQLEKDLNMVGIRQEWMSQTTPNIFWKQFVMLIKELIQHQPEVLRSLLYRIDFEEEKLQELISNENGIEDISRQMLIREMKKVNSRLGKEWEDGQLDE